MSSRIDGVSNFDTDTDLISLSGADLTAVSIVGTNPYASLCKRDGSIIGGSDNGEFVKWANGELEVRCPITLTNIDSRYAVTSPIVFVSNPAATISATTALTASVVRFGVDVTTTTFNASREGGPSSCIIGARGRWK